MRKPLILLIVLIVTSCKVTEYKPLGFFRLESWRATHLTLYKNHFFQYEEQSPHYFLREKPLDSLFFVTTGTWKKRGKHYVLSSFTDTVSNTGKIRGVTRTPSKNSFSNFIFHDLSGDVVPFYRVDFKKDTIAYIVHKQFKNLDIDLSKHDSLVFYFDQYQPFVYRKNADTAANYVITLAPYYRPGYFTNKKFKLKGNELIDGDRVFIKTKY